LSPCFAFINFFAGVLSRSRGDLADLHYWFFLSSLDI
jgi:hypothetical protein